MVVVKPEDKDALKICFAYLCSGFGYWSRSLEQKLSKCGYFSHSSILDLKQNIYEIVCGIMK